MAEDLDTPGDGGPPASGPQQWEGSSAATAGEDQDGAPSAAGAQQQTGTQPASVVIDYQRLARATEQSVAPLMTAASAVIDAQRLARTMEQSVAPLTAAASAVIDAQRLARTMEQSVAPLMTAASAVIDAQRLARTMEQSVAPLTAAASAVIDAQRLARTMEQSVAPLTAAASAVIDAQRLARTMVETFTPALSAVMVTQPVISQATIEVISLTANLSLQRQMQAMMPLLQDNFAPSALDAVAGSLQALADWREEEVPDLVEDLSDETVREIEQIFTTFEQTVPGLSPAQARKLWILWVQATVCVLSLHALILIPVAAEVVALMGSGALTAAQLAGQAAAKVWDRLHPEAEESVGDGSD